ncbi:MAG: cell division protein [Pseudomonadota bacterium]|jgi:cell division protein FtsQ
MSRAVSKNSRTGAGNVHAPSEDLGASELELGEGDGQTQGLRRWFWPGLKLVFGLCLVLGSALVVAFGAYRFAVTSDRFALVAVEADGNRRFNEDQLLRLAGASRGDNLFALDLAAAENRLVENPWIGTAKITRRLPSTLRITVTEHTAEAIAVIDGSLYLITRDGRPIQGVDAASESNYPMITGVSAEELAADRTRAIERLAIAVDILRKYARTDVAPAFAAESIHLAADGGVSLIVGSAGISLELGKGPFRQKLLMAARVIGKVRARGETPGIVFLDNEAHPERVVVRMR